jgi:hypothetical protein
MATAGRRGLRRLACRLFQASQRARAPPEAPRRRARATSEGPSQRLYTVSIVFILLRAPIRWRLMKRQRMRFVTCACG